MNVNVEFKINFDGYITNNKLGDSGRGEIVINKKKKKKKKKKKNGEEKFIWQLRIWLA